MSDWKTYKLGELLELVIDHRGKTPKKLGFDDFHDTGYPVLSAKHVKTTGLTNMEQMRFANEEMYQKWMKIPVKKGDVILTSEAPLGELFYIDGSQEYLLGQRVFGLRPKAELVNPLYLFAWLSSQQGQSSLQAKATGSTVLGIKQSELLKIDISLPELKYQKFVADILFSLNDKIHLNSQTNQTLEAIAQAIFKSWFVDFDPVRAKAQAILDGKTSDEANLSAMAVISGKAIEDLSQTEYQELWEIADAFPSELVENAEFGEVPKGWEVRKVGEIANFIKGKKPKQTPSFQENEMLPHILVASLSGKYGEFAPIEKAVICQNKETLILMDGSGSGKISIGHNGVVGSTLAKLNLNNEKYWAIIHLFLKNKELDIQQHTTGTSIPHTDKTRVLNYDLIIPCDVILNWFNGYFENTLYLILTNRNKSLSLEKARDKLLPKLLSGEIKL